MQLFTNRVIELHQKMTGENMDPIIPKSRPVQLKPIDMVKLAILVVLSVLATLCGVITFTLYSWMRSAPSGSNSATLDFVLFCLVGVITAVLLGLAVLYFFAGLQFLLDDMAGKHDNWNPEEDQEKWED